MLSRLLNPQRTRSSSSGCTPRTLLLLQLQPPRPWLCWYDFAIRQALTTCQKAWLRWLLLLATNADDWEIKSPAIHNLLDFITSEQCYNSKHCSYFGSSELPIMTLYLLLPRRCEHISQHMPEFDIKRSYSASRALRVINIPSTTYGPSHSLLAVLDGCVGWATDALHKRKSPPTRNSFAFWVQKHTVDFCASVQEEFDCTRRHIEY